MRTVKLIQAVKHDSPFIVGDVNATLDLPDDAADFAVTQGFGVYTAQNIPVVQHEPLIPEERKIIDPRDLLGPDGQAEADEAEEPEPPKRPYGNAPKSAWAAYAAAVDPDMTIERAEGMSKNDLLSQYGSRLLYTEGPALLSGLRVASYRAKRISPGSTGWPAPSRGTSSNLGGNGKSAHLVREAVT